MKGRATSLEKATAPEFKQSPMLDIIDGSDELLSLSDLSASSNSSDESKNSDFENVFFEEYMAFVYRDFTAIKIMSAGQAFGEIALVTKQKRTATIVCREDCDFITLTRESFSTTLGESENLAMVQRMNFFQGFQCFARVPSSKLMSVIHQMILLNPNLYQVLYRENETADRVYFIMEGEVEISQTIGSNIGAKHPKQLVVGPSPRVPVSILTKGCMFGQEELLKGTSRVTRAVSKARSNTIYSLNAQVFLSLLKLYSGQTAFEGSVECIEKSRSRRVLNSKSTIDLIQSQLIKLAVPNQNSFTNTNVKQKYEEMTRMKIATDTKHLCEAKISINDKLNVPKSSQTVSLRSILNPLVEKSHQKKQHRKYHTSKDLIVCEPLDFKPTPKGDRQLFSNQNSYGSLPYGVVDSTQLNRIGAGIINSCLSVQERSLLNREKQAAINFEQYYLGNTRNNFISQITLGRSIENNTNSDSQGAKTPSNSTHVTLSRFSNISNMHLTHSKFKNVKKAVRAQTLIQAIAQK